MRITRIRDKDKPTCPFCHENPSVYILSFTADDPGQPDDNWGYVCHACLIKFLDKTQEVFTNLMRKGGHDA